MLLHLTEGGEELGARNFPGEIETVVLYSDYIYFLRQHVYLGRFKSLLIIIYANELASFLKVRLCADSWSLVPSLSALNCVVINRRACRLLRFLTKTFYGELLYREIRIFIFLCVVPVKISHSRGKTLIELMLLFKIKKDGDAFETRSPLTNIHGNHFYV